MLADGRRVGQRLCGTLQIVAYAGCTMETSLPGLEHKTGAQVTSDARLIAAAPDLLAALENVRLAIAKGHYSDADAEARAAIAAAKGGA